MSEFSFDDFDGDPQPFLLIRGEVLRLRLGINIKENDRLVPVKIKVDDPCAEQPLRGSFYYAKKSEPAACAVYWLAEERWVQLQLISVFENGS
jgi:hypothetical protein